MNADDVDANGPPKGAPSADAEAAAGAPAAAPGPRAEDQGPSPFKKRRIEEEGAEAAGAAATTTAATATTATAAAGPFPPLRDAEANGDAEEKAEDPEKAAEAAASKPKGAAGDDERRDDQRDPPPGPYVARESHLARREALGELSFEYVLNDGSPASSIWLAGLRSVYSKQLPNMPREYIARLVFDRRHASVAIVRRGSVGVLGGITYRRFPDQRLGEIAFCAVAASEQVRGFGTRLMNHAKRYAVVKDRLSYFLTYADNNAVGYFSKQGFTRKITAPRARWHGYVKDYDGGTLMECRLDERAALVYADLPRVLAVQRRAVEEAVRGRSKSHVVWRGLECFSDEKRGEGVVGDGATADPFDFAPLSDPAASIPGVREAGWVEARSALERALYPPSCAASSEAETAPRGEAPRRGPWLLVGRSWRPATDPHALRAFANSLLCELAAHEDAWPFLEPVDSRDVPDYHQVVKDPMDFSTLRRRLAADGELSSADEARWRRDVEAGVRDPKPPRGRFYSTLDAFVADARRIFSNARAYNAADTIYSKLASRLEGELDALLGARVSFSGGAGGDGVVGAGRGSWRG